MSKKEDKSEPNITYSIDENTTTDTWAPASEQFTVSYATDGITPSGAGVGTVDTMDISDMMRQDAGKGMENFTFDDYNVRKPFENSVPSLEKIDELNSIITLLKKNKVNFFDIQTTEPDLEKVFLQITKND